jgi:hypothetical protein
MLHVRIAADLMSSLDHLIALLADDPVLSSALMRERARLMNHLTRHSVMAALEQRLAQRRTRERRAGGSGAWQRFVRLRGASYSALAEGFLDSRRFDSVILLALRAVRRSGSRQASSSPSSSSFPGESEGGSAEGGGTSGSTGWLITG